jgi:hypothetical protein
VDDELVAEGVAGQQEREAGRSELACRDRERGVLVDGRVAGCAAGHGLGVDEVAVEDVGVGQ